jgi:hypothetical protein
MPRFAVAMLLPPVVSDAPSIRLGVYARPYPSPRLMGVYMGVNATACLGKQSKTAAYWEYMASPRGFEPLLPP